MLGELGQRREIKMQIPDWIPAEAWAGYVEMRAKNPKTKMTARAMELRIEDLRVFHEAGHDVGAILNQSTANSWTDVYPLKDKSVGQRGKLPALGRKGQATADNVKQWVEESPADHMLESKKRFASLLAALSDYYGWEVSKASAGLYWEGLKQYGYEAIEQAAWAHTQSPDENGRWFPKVADFKKFMEGSTADQGALAWSRVDSAIRTRGTWDDVVFDDAVIHRVVADMGGWVLLGSKDDKEWPFVAKEFQQRYRSFKQQGGVPEHPERLIGMANAHNRANGQPLLPPILIGDKEKAKSILLGTNATKQVALTD
jgi:hypothetical protein